MKKTPLRKGLTVETPEGHYIIRDIDRSMTPPLVLMTEKHKGMQGRKIYIRANALQHHID